MCWSLRKEGKARRDMAPKERRGGPKGFASMDEETKRKIASEGGLASARAKKTSNRGFASMDKDKLKEISSMGGKASKGNRSHPEKNDEDVAQRDVIGEKDASVRDLESLEGEDNLESSGKTQGSLAYSDTDEDEDEGLGDGNLGRSTRGDVISK